MRPRMRIEQQFKPVALLSAMSILALATLFAMTATINAQEATVTPDAQRTTTCQLYHITVNEALVRGCAGGNCPVKINYTQSISE